MPLENHWENLASVVPEAALGCSDPGLFGCEGWKALIPKIQAKYSELLVCMEDTVQVGKKSINRMAALASLRETMKMIAEICKCEAESTFVEVHVGYDICGCGRKGCSRC